MIKLLAVLALLTTSLLLGESATEKGLRKEIVQLSADVVRLTTQVSNLTAQVRTLTEQQSVSRISAASNGVAAFNVLQENKHLRSANAELKQQYTKSVEDGKLALDKGNSALAANKASTDVGVQISAENNGLIRQVGAVVSAMLRTQNITNAAWSAVLVLVIVVVSVLNARRLTSTVRMLTEKIEEDRAQWALANSDRVVQGSKVDKVIDLGNHTREERELTDQRFQQVQAGLSKTLDILDAQNPSANGGEIARAKESATEPQEHAT